MVRLSRQCCWKTNMAATKSKDGMLTTNQRKILSSQSCLNNVGFVTILQNLRNEVRSLNLIKDSLDCLQQSQVQSTLIVGINGQQPWVHHRVMGTVVISSISWVGGITNSNKWYNLFETNRYMQFTYKYLVLSLDWWYQFFESVNC